MTAPGPPSETVVVACATCNRPERLDTVLRSFEALQPPDGCEMIFVIVDNGAPESGAEARVTRFADATPHRVIYRPEPRRGIPFARNALLDCALESGARWMVMLDDDEAATETWAAAMVAGLRAQKAALAGGPLLHRPDHVVRGWIAQRVYEAIRSGNTRSDEGRARRLAAGEFPGHVWSNNCGIDLEAVRRTGLRYDEALVDMGGSDAVFSKAMLACGETIGWVPDAVVIEFLNRRRLTLRFQAGLWRHLVLLDAAFEPQSRGRYGLNALLHGLDGVWSLLRFYRREALIDSAKCFGRMAGSLAALGGAASRRYRPGQEARR